MVVGHRGGKCVCAGGIDVMGREKESGEIGGIEEKRASKPGKAADMQGGVQGLTYDRMLELR